MRIRDVVGNLYSNSFLRAVGILSSGTLLAQGLMLLALPVLTRIYSPADFSLLAVYISIASVVSTAAALRFDVAIPIPAEEHEAWHLFVLGILCSLIVGLGVWGILLLRPKGLMDLASGNVSYELFLWLLPLGISSIAAYSCAQFYIIRKKKFSWLAKSKALQALFTVAAQIGLGVAGLTAVGLIIGYALNYILGAAILLYLIYGYFKQNAQHRRIQFSTVKLTAIKYKKFPKYSTFEAVCNAGSIQVPILLIAMAEIGPEAGFLVLAMQIIQAPLSLVGAAVGQVFLPNAAEKANKGELATFTLAAIGGLVKAGVGPLLFFGLVAPYVFSFVFGEEWRRAGVLVTWMIPWFIMQFIVSPVSMNLHIVGAQKAAMVLQLFGLILRAGIVVVGMLSAEGYISELYSLSGFVFYFIYFELVVRKSGIERKAAYGKFIENGKIVVVWLSLGILSAFLLSILSI